MVLRFQLSYKQMIKSTTQWETFLSFVKIMARYFDTHANFIVKKFYIRPPLKSYLDAIMMLLSYWVAHIPGAHIPYKY